MKIYVEEEIIEVFNEATGKTISFWLFESPKSQSLSEEFKINSFSQFRSLLLSSATESSSEPEGKSSSK